MNSEKSGGMVNSVDQVAPTTRPIHLLCPVSFSVEEKHRAQGTQNIWVVAALGQAKGTSCPCEMVGAVGCIGCQASTSGSLRPAVCV